jgi:hypothetical protein
MLAQRYDVSAAEFNTTTSVAPALKPITRWLAASYFYLHTSRGGKEAMARSKAYKDMAMENIEKLIDRKVDLVDQSGAVIDERADAYQVLSNTKDYIDTFAEDDPLHWGVDPDKIEDIEDDRE